MKIQLALDRLTAQECFRIVDATVGTIDWIEIGTGVIKEYGMAIIREMKEKYPNATIVADMKTCDAGKHEATQAFNSGADIMTVMAFASDQTIRETLAIARDYGKRVMIDLLGVDSPKRVEELVAIGVDLVCLHKGKDMQQEGEFASKDLFQLVEGVRGMEVAIAGGINIESASALKGSLVDILIVGSAITASDNPEATCKEIRQSIT
ncbi:3-hexulose-6-phosphate synthase [Sutcliffiella halmapala]|uniref:3-hexulose-6-phosphate synthase n=1 Tax=Sutcliffiella halmapala TaxID=79882 RepID=UPI000995819D|nr:3-hexulose-6-phosphate synthase [Sutcliffiella halmapala]